MGAQSLGAVGLTNRLRSSNESSDTRMSEFLAVLDKEFRDAVVVTDADLHNGPSIIYANAAFTKVTGYTVDEVIGLTPRILLGPKTNRATLRRLKQALIAGESFEGETTNYRKDGTEFINSWYVLPLRSQGEIVQYLVVQRDVTNTRKLEAVAEAKNFENVSDALVSSIRHELVNPLNSTKTAVELLLRGHLDFEASKVEQYLKLILGEIDRMEYILRTLDVRGSSSVELESIDLHRFLPLFTKLAKRDYPVVLGALPSCPLWIMASPRGLHQVLLNLLKNSNEAFLSDREPIILIDVEHDDAWISIKVIDNGRGIPKHQLSEVFDPFWTTKSTGTGVGLAISNRIIGKMGGLIDIQSEADVGTTISLALPRAI